MLTKYMLEYRYSRISNPVPPASTPCSAGSETPYYQIVADALRNIRDCIAKKIRL